MTDIERLKRLAGITGHANESILPANISHTGTEKAKLQRKHNIKPGTPEWFKLWFARPHLTGEKPIDN